MSVIHSPESGYAKERTKWESERTEMGEGKRPYAFRAFPMWMYLAGPNPNGAGPVTIIDQTIADPEEQASNLHSRGFRPTPTEALTRYEAQALEEAKLAAEIEHDIKHKLSPKAVEEVRAAQAQHTGHMPVVPHTPVKPRRKRTPDAGTGR